jgi:hypothetical protein
MGCMVADCWGELEATWTDAEKQPAGDEGPVSRDGTPGLSEKEMSMRFGRTGTCHRSCLF